MMTRRLAVALVLAGLAGTPAVAQEKLDWATLGRIRDEGFRHSQVMETAAQLTDVLGPRLTGSPQYKKAAEWSRQQLETWGLANARLESWPFGRGWSFERCSAQVVSPMSFPLVALPKAWTAGTNGPVRGKVLRVKAESEADVEALKGKIAGMVLWVGQPRELKGPEDGGVFKRYTDKQLDDLEQYQIPSPRGGGRGPGPFDREAFLKRRKVQQALEKLYAAEKPLAVVEPSERDANVLRLGSGGSRKKGDPQAVTQLVVSATQWNRVARLLDRKTEIEVEVDVKATFHEDDTNGYNVVAELPGTDKKGELVMVGAHLDSWHPGTGATDNAAGSAVMMEVLRILKTIDAKPKRTVRIGLWGGEEQGLLGSRAYVNEHFASRPEPKEAGPDELPSFMRNEPPAPAHPEARPREALRVLQPRQRDGQDPRDLPAGRRGREADLRGVAGVGEGPRRDPHHDAQHRRHRPPVLRRRGPARLPVHPGPDRVHGRDLLRHAPHRHGHVRPAAAGRPDAGRGRDRDVRLQRGDARRDAAAQAAAAGRAAPGSARSRRQGQGRREARAESRGGRPGGRGALSEGRA